MDWNLKLGLIVPSWNTVMEYEFQALGGAHTSMHSQRIKHIADTAENLNWLGTQAASAAELLSHAKVNGICYGCTASGFLKSYNDDLEFERELEDSTGIASVVSSASIVRALLAMGVKKISVASPYEPWLNVELERYLREADFDILSIKGLSTQAHGSVTTQAVKELALSVILPSTQAIFISCSNLRTLSIIDEIEAETGKLVVTSNQASFWGILNRLENKEVIKGAGRLLREFR